MNFFKLDKDWELRYEDIYWGKEHYSDVVKKEGGWLKVDSLPCDVHMPLIENGIIEDPMIADNHLNCRWVEDKSWWFRKIFKADDKLYDSNISELVLEGLDVKADLFLNGQYIGHHASAMYPFRKDVKDLINKGNNVLLVRVTSGLEYYSDLDVAKIKDYISCEYKRGRGPRGDNRRVLVRKPQYVYGWDWTPRIATCGIMGGARIEAYKEIVVRDMRFVTERLLDKKALATVEVEIENSTPISTINADIKIDLRYNEEPIKSETREVFLTSGLNYVKFELTIEEPKLWWPNGMGKQNMYDLEVQASIKGKLLDYKKIKTGIRTIKLNIERIDDLNRSFLFEINGIKTFCKGANWETPETIYARISDEKYETLVREAKEANFNMLRLNGGTANERDIFYECCDKYGILIWQDFLGFSCAAYPDELEWFKELAAKEVDYQTKRLLNHPCLALWCGNNECHAHLATYREGGYWAGDKKPASSGGIVIYNRVMPKIIKNNCPNIPYWNSSPYGGETDLESNHYGDIHYYPFMSSDISVRIDPKLYDDITCKFVSEFGCIGAPKKASVEKYYGSSKIDTSSDIWKMHTNTFEKDTVKAGIKKHYTGKVLSLDEYLLYSGLFQGLMLEHAFESMRCAEGNFGALSWSYNEAWGEIGWSLIDYYTTRKISYYFVKRALDHKKMMLKEKDGIILVFCANDTNERLSFTMETGYISFEGDKKDTVVKKIEVEPFTKSTVVAQFKKGTNDVQKGVYYAKTDGNSNISPAVLRSEDFRKLQLPASIIRVDRVKKGTDSMSFCITSDKFAHGVHFGLAEDIRLSDEYFDMLPGESKEITLFVGNTQISAKQIKPKCVYFALEQ